MKTLKTKQVNVVICWNGLRNIPPKDFPSIDEMEKTADILNSFKEIIPEFVKLLEEGEGINADVLSGKIKAEDIAGRRMAFQKKSNLEEERQGKKEISVEFETDAFNIFFQQFERWGKNWFLKLEPYLEFRKNLNATNQQPKKK